EAKILEVIQYYLLQIPSLFSLLSSLAAIVSVLFVITYLEKTFQIQALQVSGISMRRSFLAILTIGAVFSFSILLLDQTLIFEANKVVQRLKQENFTGRVQKGVQRNIFIHVPPSYLLYIRLFDLEKARMENVLIYKDSSPSSLIIAKEGKWNGERWIFYEGRDYVINGEVEGTYFDEKILPFSNEPSYFSKKYFPPDKMNIAELRSYINEYRKSGFRTLNLETEMNFKLSYPFATFILLFLGIPVGLILKRGGRGASFGLGLIISFAYYETMVLFKILGREGIVLPFLAAWIPNLIFFVTGVYLFIHLDRGKI
ncbi:MAG: LptF/LptG family permease, partial [Candidatus Aerophobetes bacterium]|nr:LptF/LptG family permease [Candidatus Aerophobetes bacterium]